MDLEKFDRKLRILARRYASTRIEIEDLEQMGRISIWKAMEQKPHEPEKYYIKAAEYGMSGYARRERTQKRSPGGGIISLDLPIGEDGINTIQDILPGVYPETLKEELLELLVQALRKEFGHGFWRAIQKNRVRRGRSSLQTVITRTVIEDIEHIPPDRIPVEVGYDFFKDRKLGRFLWVFYENSPFAAVQDAYRGQFLPWQFNRVPNGYWEGRTGLRRAITAVNWSCEKRGVMTKKDLKKIGYNELVEDIGSRPVMLHFNDSPFLALQTQFPNLKPWEVNTPRRWFDPLDNQREGVLAFLGSKGVSILGMDPEETYETGIRKVAVKSAMSDYGLRALFTRYDGSMYRLFTTLFPEQILPWTLKAKEPWRKDPFSVAADAARWLIEDYLEIPVGDIPDYVGVDLLWRVGFSGILTQRTLGFNSSPYAFVDNAYPGIFSPSDFRKWRQVIRLDVKDQRR